MLASKWGKWSSPVLPVEMQDGTATLENILVVSWTIYLSHNLTILLPGTYPREMAIYVHTKTCMKLFVGS